MQLTDRWFIPQGLGSHEGDLSLGGGLNDLATLGMIEGKWFFQENCLAVLNRFQGNGEIE